MIYKVNVTHAAASDIEGAADYIEYSLKNPDAAEALLTEVSNRAKLLETFPKKYPLVSDKMLSALGIRSISIGNYMAFYLIDESNKEVNIIRFLYKRQNWMHILRTESD